MSVWTDRRQINRWIDRWMDGWIDGQIDRYIKTNREIERYGHRDIGR